MAMRVVVYVMLIHAMVPLATVRSVKLKLVQGLPLNAIPQHTGENGDHGVIATKNVEVEPGTEFDRVLANMRILNVFQIHSVMMKRNRVMNKHVVSNEFRYNNFSQL